MKTEECTGVNVKNTVEKFESLQKEDAAAKESKKVEQQLNGQRSEQYSVTCSDSISNDSGIHILPEEDTREELVESLKEHERDINGQDENGLTSLHYAAANNDEESVKLLIECGANVDVQDKDKRTSLHFAAVLGDVKIVKYLVESGADFNVQDKRGYTPLCYALAYRDCNDTEVITYLVKSGASVFNQNTNIDKHKIRQSKQSELVSSHSKTNNPTEAQEEAKKVRKLKVLLKKSRAQLKDEQEENKSLTQRIQGLENENITLNSELDKIKNQHSKTNEVPLEKAQKELVELKNCVAGHETRLEALNKLNEENQLLKQKTRDLESKNATLNSELGKTKSQHSKTEALLKKAQKELTELKSRANIGAKNEGWTSLHVTATFSNVEIIKTILQLDKIDLNATDQDGWTILHHAANNGHADKVKYLVEKGANFEARDKNGKSPLNLATDKQNNDIVEYLQEKIKSKTDFSKGKLEKAEKRPLFSRITYMSLITTSIAGSILSVVSGLFVLSIITTSITSALIAGGIAYTMLQPTTKLKEVAVQNQQYDVCKA